MRRSLPAALYQAPVFSTINDPTEREALARIATWRAVPAGALLMEEGREATEIIVIVRGEVRVYFTGKRVEALRMGPGSVVGELEYFGPSPCQASVEALVESEVLAFHYEDLQSLPVECASLALRIQRGLLSTLAEKHQLVTETLISCKLDPSSHALPPRSHHPANACSTTTAVRPLRVGAPSEPVLSTAIGQSPAMRQLRATVARIGKHRANVLIFGEPGVGKEAVAQGLGKALAGDTAAPFVAVDSSTLSMSTVESILFGHEKGSFTGATHSHAGLFEQANGGTIYFDEIGNMPLDVQAKLLRAIQEQQVLPLGASKPKRLSFRVIAATNRDLEDACNRGEFRYDLYSRLAVFELVVPPLRARRNDIPLLVNHFLAQLGSTHTVTSDALDALVDYAWPGNVRELQNAVQYAVAMAVSATIDVSALPPRVTKPTASDKYVAGTLRAHLLAAEKRALEEAMEMAGGNIAEAARRLGTDRSNLYKKLRCFGVVH